MGKTLRHFIGGAIILGGIALAIYVGAWVCFIGGFVGVIEVVNAGAPVDAVKVAVSIAKVAFSGIIGNFIFMAGTAIGTLIHGK